MVGGGGERKTLRLVAQYADACNVFGGPTALHHKFQVLAEHCSALGRRFDEIERSTLQHVLLTADGARGAIVPAQLVDRAGELSDVGVQHLILTLDRVEELAAFDLIERDVLPSLQGL
jgi:alkanesulfonate monooxygenase